MMHLTFLLSTLIEFDLIEPAASQDELPKAKQVFARFKEPLK